MLDDVERRRFLVEPAGEDSLEAAVGLAHVQLDEGAGQLLRLPRRCGLAGAKPDHDVADPDRLARLHLEVSRDSVPLVEEADHCDALSHRSGSGRLAGNGLRYVDDLGLVLGRSVAGPSAGAALAARQGDQSGEDETGARAQPHSSPGVQA
jgi:hypothetical protein